MFELLGEPLTFYGLVDILSVGIMWWVSCGGYLVVASPSLFMVSQHFICITITLTICV